MSSDIAPECPLGLTTKDLSGWRDGDLAPDRIRHVEAHVAECGACQQQLASFEHTASGLRAIPEPALDVPHFWAGVRAQYPSQRQHRGLGRTGGRRTRIGLAAVAAALLIALGFAQLFALRGTELNARTTATATVTATAIPSATATASPTPGYGSGRPLSWSQVAFPSAWTQQGASFALTPADENTSYACVPQQAGSTGTNFGFWASHNRGVTWTQVGDVPPRAVGHCTVVMDAVALGTAIVYLEWYEPGASPLSPSQLAFATRDGGQNWTQLAGNFDYLQLATYHGATYAIRADNPATLDIGEHLVVSTDGMHSWQAVDQAMADAHAIPHAFWLNPANGSLLAFSFTDSVDGSTYSSSERSLWVSADAGRTWRRLTSPDNAMGYLAVQWPTSGAPWHVCASDQDIMAAPAQQYNHLACTQDGGSTWADRPALDIALSCSTCLKGQPYTPIATLTLVGIAPDGSVLATANDRFNADGTAHSGLFRLAPAATRWESLGALPGTDPNNTDVYPLPSGLLWLVGNPPFTTTMFNHASFTASTGIYTTSYP